MSWFNNLLGGGSSPKPQTPADRVFPHTADLAQGALRVHVHKHDLPTRAGKLGCWTFISEGLERHGHREVVLTLVRDPSEEPGSFPEPVLGFLETIQHFAAKGQIADVGAWTEFGPPGFLGRADLGAIAWVPAQPLEGVPVPPRAMTALVVTRDERALAKRAGLQRLLARLGLAGRHFPFAPWLDRKRASVAKADELEASVISKLPVAGGPGMSAWTGEKTIVLTLSPGASAFLRAQLAQVPQQAALALALELPADARAALVWHPGQKEAAALEAESRSDGRIAGAFIAFIPDQAETVGRVLEDGFAFTFRTEAWKEAREALGSGKSITIPATAEGFGLEIRGSGVATGATAGAAPPPGSRVMTARLAFKTPEAEAQTRVDAQAFSEFLNAIGGAVAQSAVQLLGPTAAAAVVAKVTLTPPREIDVLCIPGSLGATFELRAEAERRIRALPVPEVKGPISFEMEFALPPPGAPPPGILPVTRKV